ncbi:ABC transporter permease [Lewinella sp. JB7]|uniref:ABC transporter permease n=1 Tax=Lewinella sp. JB7 TaxID=2962887 RepID=UPI0020C93CD6|nr:FtsX-like permease family protein [Lewinella sp. JB7]MCP9234325.1 ABC transporter permease [Lewinella sp. JB7]
MLSHLLKLMWNKRRANVLIFLEILLAFIVLFGVYTFTLYNFDRYRSPLGFSYEHSLGVRLDLNDQLDSAGVVEAHRRIREEVMNLPDVAAVTWLGPVNPFGGNTWQTSNDNYGFLISTQMMFADEHFAETAELSFREGRWFDESDQHAKYPPIVVNAAFRDEYFPDAPTLIDSVLPINGPHRVVGVIGDFKYQSNFAENVPLTFFSHADQDRNEQPFEMLIVRTHPGRMAAVQEPLYRSLVELTKSTDVVIWDMAADRIKANRPVVIPLVIMLIISGFLLINIALGLFGVLFTQINRRRAEIGLRKAMGATPGEITAQFVREVLLVTAAGLLLGTLFAVQVPLLELLPIPPKYFYLGAVAAIATILLIVTVCALLPSRQAARLHPALVLHEE